MINNIAVVATDPALMVEARQLAERLGLPLFESADQVNPPPLLLQLTLERLELRQTGKRPPGPVLVDFAAERLAYRRRQGGSRREKLARAIGLKGGYHPTIIDATAGLGRDAFILAALGCRVQMLERSPIVHALLADGLQRAAGIADIAAVVRENLQLLTGDALTFLAQCPFPAAEVIYLDPMFPERTKSALVKKEMRLLRQVAGDDPDAGQLLAAALQKAGHRVVVKRPRHAPTLPGPSHNFSLNGKSSRFDIYLINRQP